MHGHHQLCLGHLCSSSEQLVTASAVLWEERQMRMDDIEAWRMVIVLTEYICDLERGISVLDTLLPDLEHVRDLIRTGIERPEFPPLSLIVGS